MPKTSLHFPAQRYREFNPGQKSRPEIQTRNPDQKPNQETSSGNQTYKHWRGSQKPPTASRLTAYPELPPAAEACERS